MNPTRLCVVGSANIDLTFRTPRLPRPGETLAAHSLRLGCGGKGANQAVAAARLGAEVAFVARVGQDAFGQEALRQYHAEGLDTTHVRIDTERPTGTAAIVVDDEAQNCILIVAGANASLTPADVQAARAAIERAGAVLCQGEVPGAASLAAFRLARAAGVRTVLTPAPAADIPAELLQLCDICVPNESEIELLTGCAVGSLEQAEAAALALRDLGPRSVVVTLGVRGALVLDGAEASHVPAIPVQAVDPTGAGDAFTAALAVFRAEGATLLDAARRAVHVAALAVTRPGTQAAFPRRDELSE